MFKLRASSSKFIKEVTPDAAQVVEINGPVSFSAIKLRLYGDNGSGVTRALANNGSYHLQLHQEGRQVYMGYPSWAKMFNLLNACGGTCANTSTISTTFNFSLQIPMFNPRLGDDNAIHLAAGEKMMITIPDLSATAFDSAKVAVSLNLSKRPQNYIPYWIEETDITLGGKDTDELPVPNCQLIYLVLASGASAPIAFGIGKRGNWRYGQMTSWQEYVDDTNLVNQIESAGTFALVDFTDEMGNAGEGIGSTEYSVDGGTGAIEYLAFGMHPSSPSILERSTSEYIRHTMVISDSVQNLRLSAPRSAAGTADKSDY